MTESLKRIRREIRSLSSEEWNAVVEAFWVMKNTGDVDGRIKFGSKFVSYDSMVAKHMIAGDYLV